MSTSEWNPPVFDPIRYCVFTTVAILAWVLSAPFAVALMSGIGIWAYAVAYRKGLRQSKCVLGDVRLILAYLVVAFLAGVIALALAVVRWWS